jgi:hypothetical protein
MESIPPDYVARRTVRQIGLSHRGIDSWAPLKVYKFVLCIARTGVGGRSRADAKL